MSTVSTTVPDCVTVLAKYEAAKAICQHEQMVRDLTMKAGEN